MPCVVRCAQPRVGFVIQGYTFRLCAAKRFLHGSRIILDEPRASQPVPTPLPKILAGSVKQGQLLCLVGGHTNHVTIPPVGCCSILGRTLSWKKPTTSSIFSLFVRDRLFGGLRPSLFTAVPVNGGRTPIHNPGTGPVAYSSILSQPCILSLGCFILRP